jgi:thermitase
MEFSKLNKYIDKHKWNFIILLGLIFLLASGALFLQKQTETPEKRGATFFPKETYVPNQIVVKYRKGLSADDKSLLAVEAQAGVLEKKKIFKTENALLSDYYLLTLKPGTDVIKAENLLLEHDFVEKVQPNFFTQAQDTIANDQYFTQMYALQKIQAPKAWDVTKGSKSVIVAIIDSGIDFNHVDLPKDIIRGPDFVGNTATSIIPTATVRISPELLEV